MKRESHIERRITYRKIIRIVGKDMRVQGKELHLKEDTHGGDVKTGRKVIELPKGRSHGATYRVHNIHNHKGNTA